MHAKAFAILSGGVAALNLGATAMAQEFSGTCLNLNAQACANKLAPYILTNVGGNTSLWQTYDSQLGEPPDRTPEQRQACIQECARPRAQAHSDCQIALGDLVDWSSLTVAQQQLFMRSIDRTCLEAFAERYQQCVADCWTY